MEDRTRDAVATVDLRSGEDRPDASAAPGQTSAFDPPDERFERVGELGRGGMGRVDDAYDRALGRPVAIKHMLSSSEVDLARFEREARITARLEHPGIVPIHDAGRGPDGTPYYVMRRVDGKPLDLAIGKTLAERLATIPNVLAACDAVGFAHARGIVHRDIKPTNILVGPFGETLVIDWGLAREIGESDAAEAILPSDPQLTRAGTVAGTPGFMAPEQARGEAVDARADVFALGATLYFVLAGRLPYDTASATEMVGFAGEGRAPNWRAIPEDVPPELRAIAMKAMASDPDARYADAGALAADLRQFITGNLVGAYDYGPLARFVRFVRRHRAAVAVAAVSALIVLAIGVVAVRRVLAERDDATAARALAEDRQRQATSMADRLLVQHALEVADADPIATIAALRTLRPESEHWREARVAAAAAFVRGIPFGFLAGEGADFVMVHRDSRLAAVINYRSGKLGVVDLVARTYRVVLDAGKTPYGFSWLGPEHFAIGYTDHLAIVDLAHATIRSIPMHVVHVMGDRGSRVWIMAADRRLLEVDDPAGEPRELATGVDAVFPSRDYRYAVVVRGDVAEVWTPTKKLHLADNPTPGKNWPFFGAVDQHHVIVLDNGTVRYWKLERDELVVDGTLPPGRYIAVDIVAGKYLVTTAGGPPVEIHGARVGIDAMDGYEMPTLAGAVRLDHDGSLLVVDDRGKFLLGKRAAGLRRADESLDGRFVIAITTGGVVLVWDLASVYPKRFTAQRHEIVALTDRSLWVTSISDGLARIDLTTGALEELPFHVVTRPILIDMEERWALQFMSNRLTITDLVNHREHEVFAIDAVPAEDSVLLLRADGSLSRWRPDGEVRVGAVPVTKTGPLGLASHGDSVVVAYGDHVLRVELGKGRTTSAPIADTLDLGVTTDDTIWLRQANDDVWRWPAGGEPAKVELPQPPSQMALSGDRVLFYTNESITMQRGTARHVVAIASRIFGWEGGTDVAVATIQGVPSILDSETGLSFTLPLVDIAQISARGHHVVTGDSSETLLWTIDVPEEPRALQAWLQTVTNVKMIPGSDAYGWP